MRHENFYATEVLPVEQEELDNMAYQLKNIYGNKCEIQFVNNYDDSHYKKTGCKYWYSITSSAAFTIKVADIPLTYKARNGKKITDFDTIYLTIHKKKGNTGKETNIISFDFCFKNNGKIRNNTFEINPHYFYDDDVNCLTSIVQTYHNELYNYLPDEKTQIYTKKEYVNQT